MDKPLGAGRAALLSRTVEYVGVFFIVVFLLSLLGVQFEAVTTWLMGFAGIIGVTTIRNLTRFPIRRFDLIARFPVGVVVEQVRGVLLEAARQDDRVLIEPQPSIFFEGIVQGQVELKIVAWASREAQHALVGHHRGEPFDPVRTFELDRGDVGTSWLVRMVSVCSLRSARGRRDSIESGS